MIRCYKSMDVVAVVLRVMVADGRGRIAVDDVSAFDAIVDMDLVVTIVVAEGSKRRIASYTRTNNRNPLRPMTRYN